MKKERKRVWFSAAEEASLNTSLTLFLDNQRRYQEIGQAIVALTEQTRHLQEESEPVRREIRAQEDEGRQRWRTLNQRHRLKLAFLQLAVLVPFLVVAVIVITGKRDSIYFPLCIAFGVATLVKVTLVIHEYFPRRYFKYILIGGLLMVVGQILVSLIRAIAFPKTESLLKQFREAYERFLCPTCGFPIRVGPLRFLFWTRGSIESVALAAAK